MELAHGGNVHAAALRFGIPAPQWIDLSTGISPWHWPVPELPVAVWQSLPQADERLERAAAAYYRCDRSAIVAVPGSQYALQCVPSLLPRARVAMPLRGYAEHRRAWSAAGHHIVDYRDATELARLVQAAAVEHAVVINPNNPSAEGYSRPALDALHAQLQRRAGWLVVDEAFIDASAHDSLAPRCPTPGLIVYRSLGKFFGLAGVRLGFLLAPPALRVALAAGMPPWSVSHPARWIGERALMDTHWQHAQCHRLATAAARWLQDLRALLPALEFAATALFATATGSAPYCKALYVALARRALLARLFAEHDGHRLLRFGLPASGQYQRALQLIQEAKEECACAAE